MFGIGKRKECTEHEVCNGCNKIEHTREMEKYRGFYYHPKCLEKRMESYGEVRCPCGKGWALKSYVAQAARDLGMSYSGKKKGK